WQFSVSDNGWITNKLSLTWLKHFNACCFSPLKTAYRRQVEKLIRNQFNYITKLEFLLAFRDAFNASITKSNI
ncbi:hypothetical protein K469DRAFT_609499, partial [Zopfia rhizophila CBS 207.26]